MALGTLQSRVIFFVCKLSCRFVYPLYPTVHVLLKMYYDDEKTKKKKRQRRWNEKRKN